MPWLIVGCGYTGERLARRLLDERETVIATCRTPEAAHALARRLERRAEVRVADVSVPGSLAALATPGMIAVYLVPPVQQPAPPGEAEATFAQAAGNIGAARAIYVSSTAVYPAAAGAWIDEDVAPEPFGEHGRLRLEAESAFLKTARAAGVSAVALRAAGIYGPGRGVHARLRAGEYRVIGAGDGFVSRIHVDDLVGAIIAAATARALSRDVYNVADDEPSRSRDHADAVAALLGLAPPPSIPPEQASPLARALLGGNRRIANHRLKRELGVALRYPSWREGTLAALAEDNAQ
jgi:nucleoside-diphosphate-sugar epimerase